MPGSGQARQGHQETSEQQVFYADLEERIEKGNQVLF